MRYFPVLLLLLAFATLTSGRPRKPTRAGPLLLARTNTEALQSGLPLPRPASIPMRCGHNNATCIEALRKPRRRRHVKRQDPSATTTVPIHAATDVPVRTSHYERSCDNVHLSSGKNPSLQANCLTQTGHRHPSSFKLSQCVSYGLAGLKCDWKPIDPHHFEDFCSGCHMEGTVLVCICGLLPNRVDLSRCISNDNGNLACRPPKGFGL